MSLSSCRDETKAPELTPHNPLSPTLRTVSFVGTGDSSLDLDFELDDEESEQKRIQEQRRKRQELLSKYRQEEQTIASTGESAHETILSRSVSSDPRGNTSGESVLSVSVWG